MSDSLLKNTLQRQLEKSRKTKTFLDPDDKSFNPDDVRPQLNASANPFVPRFPPPTGKNPFNTPPPSTMDFKLPMFRSSMEDSLVSSSKALGRKLIESKHPEQTTISCEYCHSTHQGPHCYKGGCNFVLEVISSAETPSVTNYTCENCGGRHVAKHGSYMDFDTRFVFCIYCQTKHKGPACQEGTCTDFKENHFFCDTNHEFNKCENPTCYLYRISMEDYKIFHKPKFVCNNCGGRHLSNEENKQPPATVDCKFCRRRHLFPACMQGGCKSVVEIETPLASPLGFPLKYPDTLFTCENCGRRHGTMHFKKLSKTSMMIACVSCGTGHPPPVCFEGRCGTYDPTATGKKEIIERKFLCQLCGRRHLGRPQQVDNDDPEFKLNTISCKTCSHRHTESDCIDVPLCEEIGYVSSAKQTQAKLPCVICSRRHIDRTCLVQRSVVNEIARPFKYGQYMAPIYNVDSRMQLQMQPLTQNIIHVETVKQAQPEPVKDKTAEETEDKKEKETDSKKTRKDSKKAKNEEKKEERHDDDSSSESDFDEDNEDFNPSPKQALDDTELSTRTLLCKTCQFFHKLPFCRVEEKHIAFCGKCKHNHPLPRCTFKHCTEAPFFNNLRNPSNICIHCNRRHVHPNYIGHSMPFREWLSNQEAKPYWAGFLEKIEEEKKDIRQLAAEPNNQTNKDKILLLLHRLGLGLRDVGPFLAFFGIQLVANAIV